MTTAATRDRTGKFAKPEPGQPGDTTPEAPPGTPYPCWDDLPEVAPARPLDAYQLPPIAGTADWAAAEQALAAAYGQARADMHARFDVAHYSIVGGTPSWEAPDAYAGCGDATQAAPVTLVAIPLAEFELDPEAEAHAATFDRLHDEQDAREAGRDTTPGFRTPIAEGWGDEEPEETTPVPEAGGEDEESDPASGKAGVR